MIAIGQLVEAVAPALNAAATADLIWWSAASLYDWAGEALVRICQLSGAMVERTDIPVAAGSAAYPLPPRHLAVRHVSLDGAALRPANVAEMRAFDPAWDSTAGPVARWLTDVQGLDTLTLHKIPQQPGTLSIVFGTHPPEVDAGSLVSMPAVCGDYVRYSVLREARRAHGHGQMTDVAAHCTERMKLYEGIFGSYWGRGQ